MATAVTGIDIGHRTVRACVLEQAGKTVRLKACAQIDRMDAGGEAKPLAAALAELDAKVGFSGRVVCASSDISALVRFVSTMPLPPDRLARLLRLELSQHVDDSGDLAADTVVIPIGGDEIMHCCVLAQPAQVYSALVDLREAGVAGPQIHFAPAAAFNATLLLPPVRDEELALLIDVGSTTTGVTLFGEDRMLACRQVPIGSDQFTAPTPRVEAESRGKAGRPPQAAAPSPVELASDTASITTIDMDAAGTDRVTVGEMAAAAKTDEAAHAGHGDDEVLVLSDDSGAHGDGAHAPGERASGLDADMTRAAEALYGQLASSVTWFKAQLKLKAIDLRAVYLGGVGTVLPGLDTYLSRRFGVRVLPFDPFAGCDEASVAGARPENPSAYAAPVGLALADPAFALKHAVRLDLRPESVVKKQLWHNTLVWPFVAAACLLVAALIACITLYQTHSAERESLANYAHYKSEYDACKATLTGLEVEKDELSRDLRDIARRIYAGRDALYAIRAIKERTKDSPELWLTKLETKGVGKDTDSDADLLAHGDTATARSTVDHDTAIDRGVVDISGRVKLSAGSDDVILQKFFNAWWDAISKWSPDGGATKLFRDVRVREHVISPRGRSEADKNAGEFPWKVRFFFNETDLEQVIVREGLPSTKSATEAPK
jgi:Tfp pilus assembly PilM family ATPase